jgi:hypothetical protein
MHLCGTKVLIKNGKEVKSPLLLFYFLANLSLFTMCLIRYGQFLATFCAARGQYASAVLRGHSLSETVLVIAATVVGLKCSFHIFVLLFIV